MRRSRGRSISIHPPLAGRDNPAALPTSAEKDFNPPAPCGAGPYKASARGWQRKFQSTRPLRGGTGYGALQRAVTQISIHPPLAGRDPAALTFTGAATDFNPPAPCGAGPGASFGSPWRGGFQSTRPLRGGTGGLLRESVARGISIHPPLAGRDRALCVPTFCGKHFNPPAPCGAGQRSCTKKTVQNIAYCTKSAFTLAVLSGFLALMRPFFLPNVHKFRCEPSEESLLAPRSHAYTIRTPSG